jgi:transcriptional regulator with XRE-family HTH domain
MSDPTFAERIKTARQHAGLTQAEVAFRLGISQPAYATWESGKRHLHEARLEEVAIALRTSVAAILSGAPPKPAKRRKAAKARR